MSFRNRIITRDDVAIEAGRVKPTSNIASPVKRERVANSSSRLPAAAEQVSMFSARERPCLRFTLAHGRPVRLC